MIIPAGKTPVVIDSEGVPAAIEMLSACEPVLFFESFTCTVNEELPDAVGVPEIKPDDAVRFKPAGSAPAVMLQV